MWILKNINSSGDIRPERHRSYKYHNLSIEPWICQDPNLHFMWHFSQDNRKITQKRYYSYFKKNTAKLLNSLLTMCTILILNETIKLEYET